jgi:protocatechuate 3,4-dioxygenase beta subunit
MTIKKNAERMEPPAAAATDDAQPGTPAGATRRDFALGTLGGAAVAVLLAACGGDGTGGDGADAAPGNPGDPDATPGGGGPDATPGTPDATPGGGGGTLDAGGAGTCTVYPQETEGPFYLDLNNLRSDIKDGKPGTALKIKVRVVSAAACAPIKDAVVDVWHCDAKGEYSGYAGQGHGGDVDNTGLKFLRGSQVTDANGEATFDTIYPGWYPGRTTHIHFKVHFSTSSVATSQMYFPEDINTAVYNTTPYSALGQKDTSNASDGTAHHGGFPALVAMTGSGASGYVGTLTITVA